MSGASGIEWPGACVGGCGRPGRWRVDNADDLPPIPWCGARGHCYYVAWDLTTERARAIGRQLRGGSEPTSL